VFWDARTPILLPPRCVSPLLCGLLVNEEPPQLFACETLLHFFRELQIAEVCLYEANRSPPQALSGWLLGFPPLVLQARNPFNARPELLQPLVNYTSWKFLRTGPCSTASHVYLHFLTLFVDPIYALLFLPRVFGWAVACKFLKPGLLPSPTLLWGVCPFFSTFSFFRKENFLIWESTSCKHSGLPAVRVPLFSVTVFPLLSR